MRLQEGRRERGNEGERKRGRVASRRSLSVSLEMFTSSSSFPFSRHRAKLHFPTYLKVGMVTCFGHQKMSSIDVYHCQAETFQSRCKIYLLPHFLWHSTDNPPDDRGSISLTHICKKKTWKKKTQSSVFSQHMMDMQQKQEINLCFSKQLRSYFNITYTLTNRVSDGKEIRAPLIEVITIKSK